MKVTALALSLTAALTGPACVAISGADLNRYVERETKTFQVPGTPDVTLTTFDGAIEIRPWDRNDVQVIVSSRPTTIAGQIADDKGAALHEGTVIVVADDASRWWDDSRWVKTARPDQDGRYQIKGLPPGDYVAVAVSYVEDGMWNDPEYLDSIRRYGQKLTLGEGDSQTRVLKVVTP